MFTIAAIATTALIFVILALRAPDPRSPHSSNHRPGRGARALGGAVGLAVLVGLVAPPANADTGRTGPATAPKAITAMKSKQSALRRAPDGGPLKAADQSSKLGSSDLMGTPADKTVLATHQVFRETNVSGEAGGNATTVSAYGLNDAMTGVVGNPAESPIAQRAVIDHDYPSVAGRFLDATHEAVLQFKETVAGGNSLFQLASPSQAVETWTVADTAAPAPGGTYQITQDDVAITNTGVGQSQDLRQRGQSAAVADGAPSADQLWTMVDAGHGDGSFSLVSVADGLCLIHVEQIVSVDICEDDITRHWDLRPIVGDIASFYPAGESTDSSVGSDGGEDNSGTLSTNIPASWQFKSYGQPGGAIPTWSEERLDGYMAGNLAAPYAMAAGDLDGLATPDSQAGAPAYHDEAVVAYTDGNDNWQLRVVDYNANSSHLLVTSPDPSLTLGKTGTTVGGRWYPGDLTVNVGDFNGDGENEIATATQDASGTFTYTFWKYVANPDGTRTLKLLSDGVGEGGQPFHPANAIALQQGFADSAVGDFDGDGRDDIALGFATLIPNSIDHSVNLGIWTFNDDLSTRSVVVTQPAMPDGNLPRPMADDSTRAPSGIELAAGNLHYDPDNGYGGQRDEIAIAWVGYAMPEHVYDPDTLKDYHPYALTPEFQIYGVETTACNNDTSCTTTTSTLGASANPTPLFPQHKTITAYREFGTGYDAAPLSFEAGGFGGTDPSDPPVWGLVASTFLESDGAPGHSEQNPTFYNQDSIVVPWQSGDESLTKWTVNDSQTWLGAYSYPMTLQRYTAYDRQGDSVVLGAPAVLNLEQNIKENVVAAEPPTHVDWLNGGWTNVSATSNFYLQTKTTNGQAFTSSTSHDNAWSNGLREGLDVKTSFEEPLGIEDSKGSLELDQKFNKSWSGLDQTSHTATTSWTTSASAQTNQDDAFSYSADDTTLYRYPILGKAGEISGDTDCPTGCRAYYDVYVPKGSVHFDNVPGKSTSLFQPDWENLNALSYPAINVSAANPVPTPDLGSYTYVDQNGIEQSVSKPLYNQMNPITGNSGTVDLDFSSSAGSGTTTTHARTWTVGADVKASGKVEVDTPLGDGSIKTTASLGFDVSRSTTDTSTGTSAVSSSQSFSLNIPQGIDAGMGYDVGTAYYYSKDGAAKVVHGVNLTSDVQGRGWWLHNYGQMPDPALNLPNRIELSYDTDNYFYDKPLWLTAPQRQLIRGFEVLQGQDDDSGLPTKGDPYAVNPQVGQPVMFQVPVHNYSLEAMPKGITASWYAVPVDSNDIDVTGPATKFGTTSVPAVPAQGSVLIQAPDWTATGNGSNTMQQYRIVVRLDDAGQGPDMHPLAGDACPTSSLEPNDNNSGDPALYDVMSQTQQADPLGCGQNNQGYGLVTISPKESASVGAERHATSAEPARAQLAGGGLVDGNTDHLTLTTGSDVPTVPVGQRITGLVHASAALQTDDHPIVAIYDGPVEAGKIIAVTRMNGVDDETGGHVQFSWTPDEPGMHELHQVLLGTSATGEDDEQIMRVNVAPALSPYRVTATATPASVKPGNQVSIKGSVSPVLSRAAEREVELERRTVAAGTKHAAWETVDRMETNSRGEYAFAIKAPAKYGAYQYRVWKVQTAGRAGSASPTLSVRVTAHPGPTITVKVNKSSVHRGGKVTFAGKVAPWPSDYGTPYLALQRSTPRGWKTVKNTKIDAHGTYTVTVHARTAGKAKYRLRQLGSDSTSPVVPITILT